MATKQAKDVTKKFPNSAALFQFCRKILDHKFGGIRVIDQDVGQILGFDPADCSHWKKGKKNVRSIQAMRSIASHLGVDERLVVDVATGEMNETEAFFEYTGYGNDGIDPRLFDNAKKDFYRKNAGSWNSEKEQKLRSYFEFKSDLIDQTIDKIHSKIAFQEAPLYLPEVANAFAELKLHAETEKPKDRKLIYSAKRSNSFSIYYYGGDEIRPYMRFKIAREIGRYFLEDTIMPSKPGPELKDYLELVLDAHCNAFAARLLVPQKLVCNELENIDVSKDIVTQLADIFWVSRRFMNLRLKSILQKV